MYLYKINNHKLCTEEVIYHFIMFSPILSWAIIAFESFTPNGTNAHSRIGISKDFILLIIISFAVFFYSICEEISANKHK